LLTGQEGFIRIEIIPWQAGFLCAVNYVGIGQGDFAVRSGANAKVITKLPVIQIMFRGFTRLAMRRYFVVVKTVLRQ